MKFADRLHRIAVTALMGLTVGTGGILGLQLYEFFTSTRAPQPPRGVAQKELKNKGENIELSS